MKNNHNQLVNISILKELEPVILNELLVKPDVWKTLDVDYFPPRVERLYTIFKYKNIDYRIHLHVIHQTNGECLYHKHRWAAAFKQVNGSYEMGITYSTDEISSDTAHNLPDLAKFEITRGNYYEMTQTDCLHYVRPISDKSYSIMITANLYPESEFRKEVLTKELLPLSDERKLEIIEEFKFFLR